jgi:hypothetical protein
MKKGIAIRGSHVHRWRISDTKIERLQAIKFYTLGPPSSELTRVFNAFYEAEYKKTRNQWRGWITDGIAEAQNLINAYFDEVFKLLFDDRGKLTYPSRLKF